MGVSISAMGTALAEGGYALRVSPELAIMVIVLAFSIAWGIWNMTSK